MSLRVVSVTPARGGSKGIPKKNIQLLGGKPLIHHVLQTSMAAKSIESTDTWVTTDSPEIARISMEVSGVNVLMRPPELATDTSSSESAILHFAECEDFDVMVFLQCTSPLTLPEDIDSAVKMVTHEGYDSVLSVCEDHGGWLCGGFTWKEVGPAPTRKRRQDLAPSYRENGAIYVTTRKALLGSGCRLSGNIGLCKMPRQRSYEIDSPEDLYELDTIMKGGNML